MLADAGELPSVEGGDVLVFDEHFAAVRVHQPDDVAQCDALAGAAAAEKAKGLALCNLEGDVIENGPHAERLGDVIESHGVHPDTVG